MASDDGQTKVPPAEDRLAHDISTLECLTALVRGTVHNARALQALTLMTLGDDMDQKDNLIKAMKHLAEDSDAMHEALKELTKNARRRFDDVSR